MTWQAPNDFYDGEVEVPETVIEYVDDNVKAALPKGTEIKGIFPHGASYWTRTAEISTEQADGSQVSFFLKVAQHETGKGMVSGEMVSMKAIHDAVPDLAPRPITWGTYASDPETHFFLCEFIDMADDLPDIAIFPAKIAELHVNGKSPTGKFGFPVQNYQGSLPQDTTWCDTWEEAFSNNLRGMFELEQKSQGPDEEMQKLADAVFAKVIPRLLRPLETGGRKIEPCLTHGDLWGGNCSTSVDTNKPVIFDASALYAHNEYDLASWRPTCFNVGKEYITAYHQHYYRSEPISDQDDRNLLYTIRFEMCSSALYPGNLRFRKVIKEEMRTLVEKFPDGYEGWEKAQAELNGQPELKGQPEPDRQPKLDGQPDSPIAPPCEISGVNELSFQDLRVEERKTDSPLKSAGSSLADGLI